MEWDYRIGMTSAEIDLFHGPTFEIDSTSGARAWLVAILRGLIWQQLRAKTT
jgi:hypothetical protein